MENSETLLVHIRDLARQADRRGAYTYSGFLSPAELSEIMQKKDSLLCLPFTLWSDGAAERRILAFGSEALFGYPPDWPVSVISIMPVSEKFAEELTHRDYLGALMNLGIERTLLGDIIIRGKKAWVYCLDSIAEHICSVLTTVRHTTVKCEKSPGDIPELLPVFEEMRINVASERIDAVTAAFTGKSRSSITELFSSGRVFVNSREVNDGSKLLKEGDILSVRGFGKAVYDGISGASRKGRIYAVLRKYV